MITFRHLHSACAAWLPVFSPSGVNKYSLYGHNRWSFKVLAMCLFYIQIEKIPTEQIKTALRGKYKATGPCEGVNKLNERQMKFANEYLIDLNAEQAAIRAGYSPKYARGNAHKLVANDCISKYIQERMKDRQERTEITQDFVLRELMAIASVNATDYARVIEKSATTEVNGEIIQLYDADGNPVKYRTVEPILTEELTEIQKKALAVIKKGRDGFEIRPYDKLRVLELLGKHLGMWDKKTDNPDSEQKDDGFMDALRNEVGNTWEE